MAEVRMSFACGLYDRMVPLYSGEVRPEGIDLDFVAIDSPRAIFDRMAGKNEFDAAEMSSSEFVSRFVARQCPFVAIPVFPSRCYRLNFITINARSGIKGPKDLEGRRVGVPLYTQTAAIWNRGHLQHDFGVEISKIHWVEGAINTPGRHGDPSVMPMAKPVPIEINDSGKSLSQLLEQGSIDAIVGTRLPDAMRHDANIRRLFPDFREVEKAYYRRTGIFPIMHLVVIRREVYERNPFVAQSLYRALEESKRLALHKMRDTGALRYMLPWLTADIDELDEVFGADPWPYGLEANRVTLQTLVDYMMEQGIIGERARLEELFVPLEWASLVGAETPA